jgi:AcrR family transcriptional regulator
VSDEPTRRSKAEAAPAKGTDARPYHHGDLQRALVEAGRRLLERDGVGALSLRAVAREAGVSAAAPYHHFKDRAALLYAIAHQGNVALNESMKAAFESSQPGRDRIIAVGVAYVGFALANPALYRLMFETTRLYDHYPDASEAEGEIPRLVAATFGASMPARKSDMDRHLAAMAGWSMFRGLAEVAQYRTLKPFKELLGGERAFLEAVLGRLDFSDRADADS